MHKLFSLTACAVTIVAALVFNTPTQAQGYYGPGMMGPGYGGGYMMGPGYGGGYMMGPGYGGNGYGPGMMYGHGPGGRGYRGGQAYRGRRLCWHQTDADTNTGYYEACQN